MGVDEMVQWKPAHGLSIFALACALAAFAPAGAAAQTADPAGAAPVAEDGQAAVGDGDIVVTARRREERLQDVPISVTAFSNEALEAKGIERATDLVNVTPTLKISSASQRREAPAYELRSISSTESNIGQDSPVALYVDEVYIGIPAGTAGAFVDLENVQVLLGPQGTLFGRNATAGAILFSSKRPVLDSFSGEAQVTVGNFDRLSVQGVINAPLGEGIAVRLVGARSTRDGYTYNLTSNSYLDNEDSWFARGSLRFETGALENTLIADYYSSHNTASGTVLLAARQTGAPLGTSFISAVNGGNAVVSAEVAAQQARGPRTVALSPGFPFNGNRVKAYGVSNVTTFDLNDDVTLKNVAGFRYSRLTSVSDLDGSRFLGVNTAVAEQSRSFSNELQLQGKTLDGNLDYIAGLYLFSQKGLYNTTAFQFGPNASPVANAHGKNQSISAFAQGTYHFEGGLEGLNLTAGARITKDKREIVYLAPNDFLIGTPLGTVTAATCTYTPQTPPTFDRATCTNGPAKVSFTKPTWTVSLDYKVSPNHLVYVAHRRGYRSGGYNSRENNTIAQLTPFSPETVSDIEAGFKGSWDLGAGTRLITNIAAYNSWYNDIQRTVATVNPQGGLLTTIANAAKATIKGFEANVELNFDNQVILAATYGYSDAVHKTFTVQTPTGPVALENIPFGSMRNSGSASITLRPDFGDDVGPMTFTFNAAYNGKYFNTTSLNLATTAPGNTLPRIDPTGEVPSRVIFNASAGWENIAGSGVSAQAFIRNIANKDYLVSTLALHNTPAGFTSGLYGEPRMYGLTLGYKF